MNNIFWDIIFQKLKFEKGFIILARSKIVNDKAPNPKAEWRQSFSTCVDCMRLRFQINYAGLSQITVATAELTQL